jgi:hypothetical protein
MEDDRCERKVILIGDNETWNKLRECKDFNAAVGYLATWAFHHKGYNFCYLCPLANDNLEYEITATYYPKEGLPQNPAYVIGGIYHHEDKRWSFHS